MFNEFSQHISDSSIETLNEKKKCAHVIELSHITTLSRFSIIIDQYVKTATKKKYDENQFSHETYRHDFVLMVAM